MTIYMIIFHIVLPHLIVSEEDMLYHKVKYYLYLQADGEKKLQAMGKTAFPALLRVMLNRESPIADLRSAMCALQPEKYDLKVFLPTLHALLKHTDVTTRIQTMGLVSEIGGPDDMQFIMPLLSDTNSSIQYNAAKVISQKGGRKESGAMQAWLSTSAQKQNAHYVQHVKKCLAEMNERLDKESREPKK